MESQFPIVTRDDLRAFHAKHFPHSATPEYILHGYDQGATDDQYADEQDEEDDLGFYSDGTKRTIPDAQIEIFRHSEIQAIIRKRKIILEGGHVSEEDEAASEGATSPAHTPTDPIQPDRPVPAARQNWTTSSARTKARNKRNRNKYKKKKREERLQKEREQKDASSQREESVESDEWDARHQANGPDVQDNFTPTLEY